MTRDEIVAHLMLHGWEVGIEGWIRVTFFNRETDRMIQTGPTGVFHDLQLSNYINYRPGGRWDDVDGQFLRAFSDYLGIEGYD